MKSIREIINLVESSQRTFSNEPTFSRSGDQNGKVVIEIGRIFRKAVRKALDDCESYGITYDEEKGMLESVFTIRGKVKYLEAISTKIKDSFGDR